jgi:hypothetical protein
MGGKPLKTGRRTKIEVQLSRKETTSLHHRCLPLGPHVSPYLSKRVNSVINTLRKFEGSKSHLPLEIRWGYLVEPRRYMPTAPRRLVFSQGHRLGRIASLRKPHAACMFCLSCGGRRVLGCGPISRTSATSHFPAQVRLRWVSRLRHRRTENFVTRTTSIGRGSSKDGLRSVANMMSRWGGFGGRILKRPSIPGPWDGAANNLAIVLLKGQMAYELSRLTIGYAFCCDSCGLSCSHGDNLSSEAWFHQASIH